MDDLMLYEKAVAYYSEDYDCDISNSYTKEHAEELIYCYVQGHSLIDFDFWTHYETLLGEKISYDAYVYIDSKFDGDPLEIQKEDSYYDSVISILKKYLLAYKKEQEVVGSVCLYSVSTTTEGEDFLREFSESDESLDKGVTLAALKYACATNPHLVNNGIFREGKNYMESNYVDGVGFTSLALLEKKIPFTKANLRDFLQNIDKDVLKEVLPENVMEEALFHTVEKDLPGRFFDLTGTTLSKKGKEVLLDAIREHPDKAFNGNAFDTYIMDTYNEFISDKTWISVYKDTLNYYYDIDNLTEILVPTDWLKETLKKEGELDFDAWLAEYTADDTDSIAYQAIKEGVIIDCIDSEIPIPMEKTPVNEKISLNDSIKEAKEAQKQITKNAPNKEKEGVIDRETL